MRWIRSVAFLAIVCVGLWGAAQANGASPSEGVSDARIARLARGINLSHWFAQSPRGDYSAKHLTTYNTERDLDLIARMGFSHVRLTLNPKAISDAPEGLPFHAERLALLDAAIAGFLARHVAVVVDLHPDDDFKTPLAKDDAAVERFVAFWRALAAHLAGTDPERVFFEVMNEPVISDAARWNAIQKQVLAAMRASAPHHTLIAGGPLWSGPDQLVRMEVVADRNVVYNFHCYEPFKFTHQGAWWAGDWVKGLKNAPYPSSPEAVAGVLADLPDEKARKNMIQYGKENWNAEKIDAVIARAAAWGKKKGVPLTCNEFGVYRTAPAADRNHCIEDMRKALEKYHIGWAMWDYAGSFGVVTGKPGQRVPDPATLKALGLKTPA